jgi:hypothetical protein
MLVAVGLGVAVGGRGVGGGPGVLVATSPPLGGVGVEVTGVTVPDGVVLGVGVVSSTDSEVPPSSGSYWISIT